VSAIAVPTVKAPDGFAIYVDPPYQEVQVCKNFIVKVNVSFIVPVSGLGINLTFDPNLMECISVTNTSFPPGQTTTVLIYNNTAGWVVVGIAATPDFMSGTIAEINNGLPVAELFNGTVKQVPRPVGGEVLTIDSLALLIPWIAVAGAVAVATVMVLASRRTFNR
jgi:hypothetical protein